MSSDELRTPLTQRTGSSSLKACFNGTNAFLGISLLTVPYALSRGGWLSLVFFLLIAAMTFYTGILLKRCMDADPSIKHYLDIAERAFGKRGRLIVSIIMGSELYLIAIGLLILEVDNLQKLFPNFVVNIGTLIISGRWSFIIITALVILPSVLLTDLSILSYVSATGVFSCIIILGSIFCVGALGGVGFHAKGTLLNVGGLPTAVSLYIVCFGGHPALPSIYISMRDRYQFNKVLLYSYSLTAMTYMLTAVVGYLMYGDSVESQISLNLPVGEVSAKVAIYAILLIPVTKYTLVITPIATALERELSENHKNWGPVRWLIRIGLLASTVVVAHVFPYFENLMAIVGSIFVVLASIVLPSLCYLKIFVSFHGWSNRLMGVVGIVVFATVAGILGTYSAFVNLLQNV